MCKIILLFFLLFLLTGFISKKFIKFLAILAILFLIVKEVSKVSDKEILTSVDRLKKCFMCDFFKGSDLVPINRAELVLTEIKNFNIEALSQDMLKISCHAGGIKISSWDKDFVGVKVEKKAKTKEDLESMHVIVEKQKDAVIMVSDSESFAQARSKDKKIIGIVDYEIKVPQKLVSVFVDSYAGDIEAKELTINTFEINAHTGAIDLKNITGNIYVHNYSGRLKAHDIAGNFKANIKSGNVEVKNIKGNIFLSTLSGNVEINGCKSESIHVGVLNGNIEMEDIKGAIEVSVKSGNIELNKVYGPVNAKTNTGKIEIKRALGAIGEVKAEALFGHLEIKDSQGVIISQGKSVVID